MNPMQIMQLMMQMKTGAVNPQQLMNQFGNNPMMKQAQNMMNSGNDPRQIIQNIAQQKGISQDQLNQMAAMLKIKL